MEAVMEGRMEGRVSPASWTADDCEALFVREQGTLKAIIRRIGARYRLSSEEIEELSSRVALKLVENDYLVLRAFEGRSSLQTYLSVVIDRVLLDSRTAEWGKWRPSASARREGPMAVRFEQLTTGRGLTFDEACVVLEHEYGPIVVRSALRALAARLPRRVPRRSVWLEEIVDMPSVYGDPASTCAAETQAAEAERCATALVSELDALPPEDRSLVRRRFFDGASVVSVARERSLEPAALYRHFARLLKMLRERLEERGVTQLDVRELLS